MAAQWIDRLIATIAKLREADVILTPGELAWLNRHNLGKPFSGEAWIADLRGDVRLRNHLKNARNNGQIAKWANGQVT